MSVFDRPPKDSMSRAFSGCVGRSDLSARFFFIIIFECMLLEKMTAIVALFYLRIEWDGKIRSFGCEKLRLGERLMMIQYCTILVEIAVFKTEIVVFLFLDKVTDLILERS